MILIRLGRSRSRSERLGRGSCWRCSSNSEAHTCISCSMSGILFEYCTVGAGFARFSSSMRLTQFSISFVFFSACSMDRTSMGWRSWCLQIDRSCRSRIEGSEGFRVGSSRRVVPRLLAPVAVPRSTSRWPSSGRGIFRKASTSPMLGISSGMKGLSCESKSMVWGVYRSMKPNSSLISSETFMFLYSLGSYAPAGPDGLPFFSPDSPPAPDPDSDSLEPEELLDSLSLSSPDCRVLPTLPLAEAAFGEALSTLPLLGWKSSPPGSSLGELRSELAGVLTSSSSVSIGIASSYGRSAKLSSFRPAISRRTPPRRCGLLRASRGGRRRLRAASGGGECSRPP
mmetsp:Transcript_39521/g.86089  ORF Transcript_39521/g.86089 Transcript_39521/m.86089 type:complete len:341 (+) Transcript_39521:443-1465(+)